MTQKINIFLFLGLLFIGFLTGLNFPDTDQGYKITLGHRSIITHSILLPYVLYYFFIKKRALYNKYFTLIIAGFFGNWIAFKCRSFSKRLARVCFN